MAISVGGEGCDRSGGSGSFLTLMLGSIKSETGLEAVPKLYVTDSSSRTSELVGLSVHL
jgi:hypothetical protein